MSEAQRKDIIRELRLRSFSAKNADLHAAVTTKSGDEGETSLLFGRTVHKWHPRIKLVGKLDMLSSYLNLCKIGANERERHGLNKIQESLVYIMGEVATHEDDWERHAEFYHRISQSDVEQLQEMTAALEKQGAQFTAWVEKMELPQAFAETARTAAREAESMAWKLVSEGRLRKELARWLNRLSDYLWTVARI
jgi:cob(I)alamin adenosyltransferase